MCEQQPCVFAASCCTASCRAASYRNMCESTFSPLWHHPLLQGVPRLGKNHAIVSHVKKNLCNINFKAQMNREAVIVKAIHILCQRKRKVPNIESIHLHLKKNNIKKRLRASLDQGSPTCGPSYHPTRPQCLRNYFTYF